MSEKTVVKRSLPFPLFVQDDYLEAGALSAIRDWSHMRKTNEPFTQAADYDAAIYAVGFEDGQSLCDVFSDRALERTSDHLGVEINQRDPWRIDAALHVHSGPSKAGWVHSDLSPGWFREAERKANIGFSQMDIYHKPSRPNIDERLARFYRRIVCILFLTVEEINARDGCLGIYESARQPSAMPSLSIEPKENRLIAFEVCPYSYHAFRGMKQGRRESLIYWLHDSFSSLALKGWDESDVTNWR